MDSGTVEDAEPVTFKKKAIARPDCKAFNSMSTFLFPPTEPITIVSPQVIDDQSILADLPSMPSSEKPKALNAASGEQKVIRCVAVRITELTRATDQKTQSQQSNKDTVLTPADLKAIRTKHANKKDAAKSVHIAHSPIRKQFRRGS